MLPKSGLLIELYTARLLSKNEERTIKIYCLISGKGMINTRLFTLSFIPSQYEKWHTNGWSFSFGCKLISRQTLLCWQMKSIHNVWQLLVLRSVQLILAFFCETDLCMKRKVLIKTYGRIMISPYSILSKTVCLGQCQSLTFVWITNLQNLIITCRGIGCET